MAIEGYVDATGATEINGWVYDSAIANEPLTVEIVAGARVVGTVTADGFRQDLLAAGKGNGKHAFALKIAANPTGEELEARLKGKRYLIPRATALPVDPRYKAMLFHPLDFGFVRTESDFTTATITPLETQIVERLVRAYRRATADDPHRSKSPDMWADVGNAFHGEIIQLLHESNVKGVANYLRDAHARGITWGITQGPQTTATLRNSSDARRAVITTFADTLVSFAEYLGVLDVESPEQQGQWGENLHVDLQELIEKVDAAIGIPIVPPPVVGSLFGIKAKAGVLSARDIGAAYAALRLRGLAEEFSVAHPSVCEIGGGLGSVAYYANRLGIGRYTIVDLPLINVLQGYYLLRALPGTEIGLYDEPNASTAGVQIIPTWQFEQPEPRYDFLLNQDSFPEMHPNYAARYLRSARTKVNCAFLSINQEGRAPQSGSARQTVVRELVDAIGGYRRISRNRHWLRGGYVEEVFKVINR